MSILNSDFTISIFQMNSIVGSIGKNSEMIIKAIQKAEQDNCDLLVLPELALSGYLPMDLFLYSSLADQIDRALEKILQYVNNTYVVLGLPRIKDNTLNQRIYYNSAVILHQGKIYAEANKILIPNYDVFGESRYFQAAKDPSVIEINGIKIGIQICEDMWDHLPYHNIKVSQIQKEKGAELIINISASPFSKSKPMERLNVVKKHVKTLKIPFLYVNQVGGQDEIVFDGRSFFVNEMGKLVFNAPAFKEGQFKVLTSLLSDVHESSKIQNSYFAKHIEKEILDAIELNLRDYLRKVNFNGKLIIALSGGIDSAVTAYLATIAVGAKNVIGIGMPSKFSSEHSQIDAKILASKLGIEYYSFPIQDIVDSYVNEFQKFPTLPKRWSIADENIQARIRGNILMYFANKINGIVISTGNKSEVAVGYCTLYGDTVGGKNLIGDLYKHEVYSLGRYLNSLKDAIPESTFTKEPSAELRPNQKDSDALPDYPILDSILEKLIDQNLSTQEIVNLGFSYPVVEQVSRLVVQNEFKRDQLVQTVKISDRAFGKGRIIPIASDFIP